MAFSASQSPSSYPALEGRAFPRAEERHVSAAADPMGVVAKDRPSNLIGLLLGTVSSLEVHPPRHDLCLCTFILSLVLEPQLKVLSKLLESDMGFGSRG